MITSESTLLESSQSAASMTVSPEQQSASSSLTTGRAMSQSQQVLEHLRKGGSLTAIEALQRYGTFRLAARIADLRQQGHIIDTGMLNLHNGKRVAVYSLIKEATHG
jgi:hypothetical protein